MMIKDLTDKFLEYPHYLRNGAGKLANLWKCSTEDVRKARKEAQTILKAKNNATPILDANNIQRGLVKKKFASPEPLTVDQATQLYPADVINSRVSNVVNRYKSDGTFETEVQHKVHGDKFFNKEELKVALREIFPNLKPISLPVVKRVTDKALIVLLSDDHVGAINGESLYGNSWNETVYLKRLMTVANEIKAIGQTFEEVHIISLGDQLNGFNQQTTRGGHEVTSLTNREQFLMYVDARTKFYNDIFMSGVSNNYYVHDIENSNHSGNDFSFMANFALGERLLRQFPQVKRRSYFQPLNFFEYGKHVVGFCHGKDEKNQRNPLPYKMDNGVDSKLQQYFDKNNMSPNKKAITLYKGDLHKYGVEKAKFGRYINTPSIMGNSDFGEVNFGHTDPGAILEILEKDTKRVNHIPVWFD